jgi:lipopolysaccharide export system permease protein
MKTYTKFLITNFIKSLIYITLVLFGLVAILNVLGELEFFKNINVKTYFPLYLAVLNSPSFIFEMFPFIFLLSTQVFFFNILENNQIQIFKYSGLKNSQIIKIISLTTFFISILLITLFYNMSSNLKSFYLELKLKYSVDGKYLAVITNNGLWIKDVVDGNINIINSSKINDNHLINAFITQFDEKYNVIQNIKTEKINIKENNWKIYEPIILKNNKKEKKNILEINSNFNYEKIKSLFSNLSSLSLYKLIQLKKNYDSLDYSSVDVSIQIQKLVSYPIFLTLMTILASIIMYSTRAFKSNTLKLVFGLFFSVLIYYINNFFNVLGNTEKLTISSSIWIPILILSMINIFFLRRINEK